MRVGLLSDAHGNHHAVRHALDWLRPRVDEVLFAGDAFSDHRFSNAVVEMLRDGNITCVLGNHELSLLGPAGTRARAAPDVRADLVEWIADRPTQVRRTFDGLRLLMVHASPWPPHDQYLTPGAPAMRAAADLDADVLVAGHAHQPYAVQVGSTLVVNPGSVGCSDGGGPPDLLCFAVLDTAGPSVTHYGFEGAGRPVTALRAP